jgi:haloalkane dehalogenase
MSSPNSLERRKMIQINEPYERKYKEIFEKRIAYIEAGEGDPIVLIHGNPTSSFLWRNIIPELSGLGRVIAPDLIGHGYSEKLPMADGELRYSFRSAYKFLDGLLEKIGVDKNVTLVLHDWGSALGFHWAKQNADSVRAIAYMEGIVCPLESWDDWPEAARGIFQGFRGGKGENLILERNMFVEAVLPSSIMRTLSKAEMDIYRSSFMTPEDRRPTLNWPRQIPIAGEPADIVELVSDYAQWLQSSDWLPKLFINADPGSILVGKQREFCRSWPNQREVTVSGTHFIQEDSPLDIAVAISSWLSDMS